MHNPRIRSTHVRASARVARAQVAADTRAINLVLIATLGGLAIAGCAPFGRRDLIEREDEVAALKLEVGRRKDAADQTQKTVERLAESVKALESEKTRLVSDLARRQTESEYHAERASVLEKSLRLQDQRVIALERQVEDTGRVSREIFSLQKEAGGMLLGSLKATEVPERAEESGVLYFPVAPVALRELHRVLDGIHSRLSRAATLVRRLELESSGEPAEEKPGQELEFAEAMPVPLLTDRSAIADAPETPGGDPPSAGWRLATGGGLAGSGPPPATSGFWGQVSKLIRQHVVRLFEPGRRWDTEDIGFLGAVLIGAVLVFLVVSTPFRWMLREVREKELALLRKVVGTMDRVPAAIAVAPGAVETRPWKAPARADEPVVLVGAVEDGAEAPQAPPAEPDGSRDDPGRSPEEPRSDTRPEQPTSGEGPGPNGIDFEELRLTQPLPGRGELSRSEVSKAGPARKAKASSGRDGGRRRDGAGDEDHVSTQEMAEIDADDLAATQEISDDLAASLDRAHGGGAQRRADHESTQRIALTAAPPKAEGATSTQPIQEIAADDLAATQSISDSIDERGSVESSHGPGKAPATGGPAPGEPAATQPLPDLDGASGLASTDKMPDIYADGNRDRRDPTRDAELTTTQPLGYGEAPRTVRPDKPQRGAESKLANRPSDGVLLHETTVLSEPGGEPGSDLRATQILPDLTLASAGDRPGGRPDASTGSSEAVPVAVSSPQKGKADAPPDRPEPFPHRGSKAGNRSQRTRRTLASDKDLLAEIEELIGRRLDPESR